MKERLETGDWWFRGFTIWSLLYGVTEQRSGISSLRLSFQCLRQIGNNILYILDTYGQTDQTIGDTLFQASVA